MLSVFAMLPAIRLVKAEPGTIRVPTDYGTIQAAIDTANTGDTIYVYAETYYEHVVVNKAVSLIGENKGITVIDGSGTGSAIGISHASNVTVSGFTISNSGTEASGIYLFYASYCTIIGNNIINHSTGVSVWSSNHNILTGNTITNNDKGLDVSNFSDVNEIVGNTIASNYGYGIYLDTAGNNSIYHNNFWNNTNQVYVYNSVNFWDKGYPSGGNYWSDYNGTDGNGDGIGDSPYVISEGIQDNYPLMNPWESGSTRYP